MDKLLAGIFAFVMVTGMIFPAYAEIREAHIYSPSGQPISIASDDDVIYQNGNAPDPEEGTFLVDFVIADDFVLSSNFIVTDAHFVAFLQSECDNGNGLPGLNNCIVQPLEPMFYFIFADNNGEPGAEIDSGTAQNLQRMEIEQGLFEIWFDFEEGVPLDGGVTYWFAMHFTEFFEIIPPDPEWVAADVNSGNEPRGSSEFPPQTWFDFDDQELLQDFWFQLTGDDRVVGGELLPIDTTSLLLAAAQSPAWITALTIAALGIGAFVFTRNPSNLRNIRAILRYYLDRF